MPFFKKHIGFKYEEEFRVVLHRPGINLAGIRLDLSKLDFAKVTVILHPKLNGYLRKKIKKELKNISDSVKYKDSENSLIINLQGEIMSNKAFISAQAEYDQIVQKLNKSVENGNQINPHGPGRIFNTRVAVTSVEKAKALSQDYQIDPEPLNGAVDKIWQDLMDNKQYHQAKVFAENLGL